MTSLVQKSPRFQIDDAIRLARDLYGLDVAAVPLPSERDQNFRLCDASGARYVLKIANSEEALEILDLQNQALKFLAACDTGLTWPRLIPTRSGSEIVPVASASGAAYFVRVLGWVEGACFADVKPHGRELLRSLGRGLGRTDAALANFSHHAARRTFYWDLRRAPLARQHVELLSPAGRSIVEPIFARWEAIDWADLPSSVIHNDANDYNILVHESGARVASILDFGDMVETATVCDLAIGLAYAMLHEQDPIAAAAEVTAGYHEARPLSEAEIDALYPLAATRLAMSVCYCAGQARNAPHNEYLNISNRPAWALLEKLDELPEGWPREVFRRACGVGVARTPGGLLASRRKRLGPSLSISYREPLHIIRGWRQYLYDSAGRAYLDCVNNVAHVGHCHPRVVQAAARQMALLNTNTRYLHELLVEYIERLAATLPAPLGVVYLVCSGSEANELALRLARAHTRREGVVVMDTAYHGNTNALIDISPYKFAGPGGRGKPPHVQVVSWQSDFRPSLDGVAAFFCESALSCAGQVILRPGYLQEAYAAVRAAGGVCIADEVQTGFGRPGSHFWMFETQGVVPDIVTLGKPIGNGHPLGAVVTTPEIAASFANGMEYFNTFGGNPVSCAVGLAVLDVIRDEGLQENARVAGGYLLRGLADLAQRHPLIADVRGLGLFLGFEMRRETGEPAAEEASDLVNCMKERGVLLSTDGPFHNVIKVKPPLIFSRADCDFLLGRLDRVLP
ncbi:MAG TPA: aminotransferase class III-fold pyridoxal phosphate-dependent enzyme [Bryobacteraceae bacterium]|nr:aminotransferase class III-fold pyridoxal phosphate-dependent enzyme [Bryobacteraceae bacterium]